MLAVVGRGVVPDEFVNLLFDKGMHLHRIRLNRTTQTLFWSAAAPAFLLALCAGCAVPQPRGQGKLQRIVEPTTHRGYWLYLPKAYTGASSVSLNARRWPLVVSFHGMKPFDNARPQALEWQQEADRYGYIVVAPELLTFHMLGQFPLRTVSPAFKSDEEATLAIMDHVFQTTRADPGAVLSTSWSSGGYMAHYMLNRYPNRFTCLAVRQSNFSPSVLDPDIAKRSMYHPILILNTQNDFAICKRESKEAIEWYHTMGYKNVFWIIIKDKGHERTPDMAAEFFARIVGVEAATPPAVLVGRQAIDGNEEGIAFLSGKMREIHKPSEYRDASRPRTHMPPPPRGDGNAALRIDASRGSNEGARQDDGARQNPAQAVAPATPSKPVRRSPLKIRVSSAIGIEPLHLGFSAECPASWRQTAEFVWKLDGESIGTGINGQKTLADAGEHTLSVSVVTSQGEQHRATRTIRVLPRLDGLSSSTR